MTKWWETADASQLSIIKLTSEVRSASSFTAVHDLQRVFAINHNRKIRDAHKWKSAALLAAALIIIFFAELCVQINGGAIRQYTL